MSGCRYADLLAVCDYFDSHRGGSADYHCPDPAAWSVVVERSGDGMHARVEFLVCAPHEKTAARDPGHVKSIPLRPDPEDPA